MRLSVKNFQCWSDASLDIDGLTVLVGPSNKGKSSLFRALKGILRNEIPDEFVRDNQDEPLEIELELDGVNVKAVRKRKGSTKYTLTPIPHKFQINKDQKTLYDTREEATSAAELLTPHGEVKVYEKVYTSLGGKVPDEIEKLKFGEVKIGDYTIDPIFAGQNKAQFLIDPDRWKSTELNAILGAFSSTEKLDVGKKEANTRITQRKSEASTLASEIRSAEERSAELLVITGEASVLAGTIHDLEVGIRGDETIVGQLGSAILHQSRLEPLQEVLDTLTLPDLTETTTLAIKAANLELAGDSFVASRFLRRVELNLDEIANSWTGLMTNFKKTKGLGELFLLSDKAGVSRMDYANRLAELVGELETQLTEAKTLNSSISYLAVASATLEYLCEISDQTSKQGSLLLEAEDELEVARQEFAADEARKKAATVKPGICPKCGMSLEHTCQ